jgi:hypothetical protein
VTTVTSHNFDTYEINYTSEGVTSIIRYRQGLNSCGIEVNYETLSPALQEKIFNKLRQSLKEDERERTSNNGS